MKLNNRVTVLEKDVKDIKKRVSILERNIVNELTNIKNNMLSIKRWIVGAIILVVILFLSIMGSING